MKYFCQEWRSSASSAKDINIQQLAENTRTPNNLQHLINHSSQIHNFHFHGYEQKLEMLKKVASRKVEFLNAMKFGIYRFSRTNLVSRLFILARKLLLKHLILLRKILWNFKICQAKYSFRCCSFKMLISPAPCVVSKFLCVNIGSVVGQQPLRLELQKASEAALELT